MTFAHAQRYPTEPSATRSSAKTLRKKLQIRCVTRHWTRTRRPGRLCQQQHSYVILGLTKLLHSHVLSRTVDVGVGAKLYGSERYSVKALSNFASIDAKNAAVGTAKCWSCIYCCQSLLTCTRIIVAAGCTLLEARSSREELQHLAEVYVQPFSVPRANGGAKLTKELEKMPVLGSVALAPVLRPATSKHVEVLTR